MRSRYVALDGDRFHYFGWGESGPTVVLVHATGFHGYVWKPIAQGFGRDHRVLALDQRGHGNSPKPQHGYTWDVFGTDLSRFLTALKLSRVTAVGHSAGATAIALCAAAHPELIARAVLIDPVLFPRGTNAAGATPNPLAQRARKRRMVWESRTALFQSYRVRPPFETWTEDVLRAYIEKGTRRRAEGHIELKCPGSIEAQIYEMAPQLDGFEVLSHVDAPTLLIRGAESATFPEGSAARALSLLRHGSLQVIADTTHFVPMERPDAVEHAVRAFLDAGEGQRGR